MATKKTAPPPIARPVFTTKAAVLTVGARALYTFIDNDSDLHRQQHEPCRKNLVAKICREEYDSAKALDLFAYLVENGAKKYGKENVPQTPWHKLFSMEDRKLVAQELAHDFESEWKNGSFRNMAPAKYQGRL